MDDPIAKELELLLSGYGFNYYRIENQLRADDLLVRQKAGASFGQAAAKLEKLAAEFQLSFIPAPNRQQPFPPADLMERLNALRRLRQRVLDQESLLQGLSSPAQDKIWRRLRNEEGLLNALLQADVAMLQLAAEMERGVAALTGETWKSADAGKNLSSILDRWDSAIRDRQERLQIQAYR
jgi:hypothetical protein